MVIVRGDFRNTDDVVYVKAAWRDPAGFDVSIDGKDYEMIWDPVPADLNGEQAIAERKSGLERRLTAARFKFGRRSSVQAIKAEEDGTAMSLAFNVIAHWQLPTVKIDLGQLNGTDALLRAHSWFQESLDAYAEGCRRDVPWPRGRLYWALEVLEADAGGSEKELSQRLGWSISR